MPESETALDICQDAGALIAWLERSSLMIDATLAAWTANDLAVPYLYTWNGQQWAIPRQSDNLSHSGARYAPWRRTFAHARSAGH